MSTFGSSALRRIALAASVLLLAPAMAAGAESHSRWWSPGENRLLPRSLGYDNERGRIRILNAAGDTDTRGHPFFMPLGSNGRACVTCHQPADGMSISTATLRERWEETRGRDPVFAAIDGSNCPHLPQRDRASHSLLLDRGLFRIFLPWPPRARDGSAIAPEFTIEVVRDPTGCNTHPVHGLNSPTPSISVFRRPRMVGNLKYVTQVDRIAMPFEVKSGEPLDTDPETGARVSMNIMADSREPTLRTQASSAAQVHLQMKDALTPEQLRRIVDFERQLFVAQGFDREAGDLEAPGAPPGLGPAALMRESPGVLRNGATQSLMLDFSPWNAGPGQEPDGQAAFRASVARGAALMQTRTIWIRDVYNFNTLGVGNPQKRNCVGCHNMAMTGLDVAPGYMDLGTTNWPHAEAADELPLFKLTCSADARPHPYLGRVIYTHDPGRALVTGRCREIGAITMQQLRGLAARAPYFSNGSASTLREVIDIYDRRFDMRLTEQEKQDFVNFLGVL